MKIFTVGSKSFVTSFQLAGVPGIISETPQSAFDEIKKLTDDSDVGLILVSDDISEPINDKLTLLRAERDTLRPQSVIRGTGWRAGTTLP